MIVHDISSPTRTTLGFATHERTDVVDGDPNTTNVIGLFTRPPPTLNDDEIAKFVVAIEGALNVNVNVDPPLLEMGPTNPVPNADETEKSDESPVVIMLPTIVVIVHEISSPTRTTLGFATHDRTDVVEG